MFFFSLERGGDLNRVRAELRARGRLREVRHRGWVALWADDWFTTASEGRRVQIASERAGVDTTPVCSFVWHPARNTVVLRRRWSGEFAAYYWRAPFVIASHLRLAALAFGSPPSGAVRLAPSEQLNAYIGGKNARLAVSSEMLIREPFRYSRAQTVTRARRLLAESVGQVPPRSALLLSGGIDSSAIAATAAAAGIRMPAFVFSLARQVRPQTQAESDVLSARLTAKHLGMPLAEIRLDQRTLAANIPLALQLAETPRGTIVDEAAALVTVARELHRRSIRTVLIGEAADDLFGGFKFVLRLYRGAQLRRYFQGQLERELPDELAVLQNIFRPWGISVVDPYWTEAFLRLGYNLPLRYRVDRQRQMKAILREAFAAHLPPEIVERPKCVTRDATQVRDVLAERFGVSRERYRSLFKAVLGAASRL